MLWYFLAETLRLSHNDLYSLNIIWFRIALFNVLWICNNSNYDRTENISSFHFWEPLIILLWYFLSIIICCLNGKPFTITCEPAIIWNMIWLKIFSLSTSGILCKWTCDNFAGNSVTSSNILVILLAFSTQQKTFYGYGSLHVIISCAYHPVWYCDKYAGDPDNTVMAEILRLSKNIISTTMNILWFLIAFLNVVGTCNNLNYGRTENIASIYFWDPMIILLWYF